MTPSVSYCTFRIGDLLFGIEVEKVQEVFRARPMTRVPLAGSLVSGLINLRGTIVPALDLRPELGCPPRPAEASPLNVLVHTSDGLVSFLVDEIGDVLSLEAADFEPPPQTLAGVARRLIRGACKLDRQLMLVPDAEGALELADEGVR